MASSSQRSSPLVSFFSFYLNLIPLYTQTITLFPFYHLCVSLTFRFDVLSKLLLNIFLFLTTPVSYSVHPVLFRFAPTLLQAAYIFLLYRSRSRCPSLSVSLIVDLPPLLIYSARPAHILNVSLSLRNFSFSSRRYVSFSLSPSTVSPLSLMRPAPPW